MGVPLKYITESIEIAKDDKWRNSRYCLNAAFSTGKIKNMVKTINEAIDIFMKKMEENDSKPFDVMDTCKRLTFDVICRTTCEISTNIQNNEKNIFTDSLEHVFQFGTSEMLDRISMCFPELEPIPTRLRWLKDSIRTFFNLPSAGIISKTCENIIKSRKETKQNPAVNLLQLMLNASQNNENEDSEGQSEVKNKAITLSDESIIANTFLFLVGGYETIGSTLGYCLYKLAENFDVQEKVRDEINNHLYEKEDIEYSDLANLQYLDQVIAEISRLFPVYFPGVNRVSSTEFRYKDIVIPKNSVVTVPLWYLHRSPDYWSSPEKFMPERFSAENRSTIDPFVYQPFGAGPRSCLGMRLAQIVIKLALVRLLKSYRLEKTDDDETLELNYQIVFVRPQKNLFIRAVPIE
ncbi:cytochrome P450 3A11-like [Centruroides sculpturatus]|uniref:cytochrome P450 3A11-like n=1 Tax=Centruroides sculpturatus TaxID=218467 RepID=UPI000C6CF50D|nr:cytochrome P450 3A11-like [Centruroides sculpturatus]